MGNRVHVVVTAGPTREPLDPIRYISNASTGAMGCAVAAYARTRGHIVTLISGPSTATYPPGVRLQHVTTARQMRAATMVALQHADALVMTAAVSDYRPAVMARTKMKRCSVSMSIRMVANPDILADAGKRFSGRKILVGFALESHQLITHARRKLRTKRLDLIVGNTIRAGRVTFGQRALTDVVLIDHDGIRTRRARATKRWVAGQIIQFIESRCGTQVA
jgi:phosphopantothenoylcysteine decarboxylase / phosphopantothenate---cysteine ligase